MSSNSNLVWFSDNAYSLPSQTGAVQWNGVNKCFEVSFGGGWQRIEPVINFSTGVDLQNAVDWVGKKIKEEEKLQQMLDKYPALKDAKEKFDIVYALVKNEEKNGSN